MVEIVVVDSPEALARARELRPNAVIATENPFLLHDFGEVEDIVDIDALLPSHEAREICIGLWRLRGDIDQRVMDSDLAGMRRP